MSPAHRLALRAVLALLAAFAAAASRPNMDTMTSGSMDGVTPAPRWHAEPARGDSSFRSLRAAATTCTDAIPACLKCDTNNKKSTCRTCRQGYQGSRGSKNCVCPPGKFELCDGAGQCSCQSCGRGFYCPGGDMDAGNGASADRGRRLSCFSSAASSSDTSDSVAALGLTTRSTRATTHRECVTMPGWFMTSLSPSTQAAAKCTGATYSPGGDRRSTCRSCQDGSEVDSTLPAGTPLTSSKICKVPAGKFVQGNQLMPCVPGTFRTGQASVSSSAARSCTSCASGWTTAAQGSTGREDCTVGTAGYELGGVQPGQAASLCNFGTFYDGSAATGGQSTCRPCPDGTVTQRRGAESEAECGVPPGYYVKAGAGLVRCPSSLTGADGTQEGFYRAEWVDASQRDVVTESGNGSTVCSPCGSGILSDPLEDDENPLASAGSKVAASTDACYVIAGTGLSPDPDRGGSVLKATPCPSNTYGAAGVPGSRVYGLSGSPCAPCPRNTASPPMSTSQDNCTVSPGYGFTDGAIVQCADGYYSAGGARAGACSRCPPGRTTVPGSLSPSTEQGSVNHCYIPAGFGLSFKGLPAGANPFEPPAGLSLPGTTVLSSTTATVVQCPASYYGEGGGIGNVNTLCLACPVGFTTEQARSESAAACSLCRAGFGNAAAPGSLQCRVCELGTYSTEADTQACTGCPTTVFGFSSSFGDAEDFVSQGTTLTQGSTSSAPCVARASQLGDGAGQSFALDGAPGGWSSVPAATSAAACVDSCARDSCCFASFEHASATQGSCRTLTLQALPPYDAPAGGIQLLAKLLPSDAMAMGGSSAGTQAVASGSYTQCDASAWASAGVDALGVALDGANAGWLAKSRGNCQVLCDSLIDCWGFFYNRTAGACLLRAGSPSSDTRSFFVAPLAAPCAGNTYLGGLSSCVACPAGTQLNAARTGCIGASSSLSPSCARAIACGGYHSLALLENGTVVAWGRNNGATPPNRLTPAVAHNLTGVRAIVAGGDHAVALMLDGTAYAYGYQEYGQLGDGTTIPRSDPVLVQGLMNVRAMSARYHTVALLDDGTVWAFGINEQGQVGDGTTTNRMLAVQVPGLRGVRAVAAGRFHTLALLDNGTVVAWGGNVDGALGDGTTTDSLTPVAVKNLTGVRAIVAGVHSVALLDDGTVRTWGQNTAGQLGDGTNTRRLTPVAVPGLRNVRAIEAGLIHSMALLDNGTVFTWGSNWFGMLGVGASGESNSPVAVPGLSNVTAIAAGSWFNAALLDDGTVRMWGENTAGQLGDGTTVNRFSPVVTLGFESCVAA